MRSFVRATRDVALVVLIAAGLFGAVEGMTRIGLRLWTGAWPRTLAAVFDEARRATATLYREHPFLLTAAREGARDPRAGRIEVNSLGYRSPERPREKPAGVERVVCAGGSTTWDTLAESNAATWPARLEAVLRTRGAPVEVWNAGFPGWTSLENVIALASRDLALAPDLVVFYQGINDLQPAAHEPSASAYVDFHARMQHASMGVDAPPLPWYRRLVVVERARNTLFGQPPLTIGGLPAAGGSPRQTLTPEGVRVFERNVRSFIGVARAHGVRVLLVTQALRRRAAHWASDRAVFEFWIPDLEPEAVFVEIERLNDVLRALAAAGDADLADVARDVAWTDADFLDPMHTSAAGSQKLAAALAGPVTRLLVAGRAPEAGR